MSLVVTANQQRALDRIAQLRDDFPDPADQAMYLTIAAGILAHNAPDVLHFILDAVDRKLADSIANEVQG